MSESLNLDIDQLPAYLESLGRGAEMIDFTPAFEEIALVVAEDTRENFDGSHAPDGTPWPPLKKPKMNKRSRLPFSGKSIRRPLVLTGNLMRHACDHVIISARSLLIAPSVLYGIFHQLGTRTIPQRQFLGWNERTLTAAGQILAKRYAEGLLGGASQGITASGSSGSRGFFGRAVGWVKSLFR